MAVCERLAGVYLFMGSIPALDRVIKGKKCLGCLDCRFAKLCADQVHLDFISAAGY